MALCRAKARRVKDLGLVVVDYCGLVAPSDPRVPREQQIAGISKDSKMLAEELDCPVLLLSQLNRSAEQAQRAPKLSDLRESGALEQDADQVWLLYRHAVHDEAAAAGDAIVKVGKNRNGPTPTIELIWQPERAAFRQRQLGDGLRVEASATRKAAASFG